MEKKDQKLTLETGLTPTFGSLGEYMLDLPFELRCLGIIWRTMKEGCDRLVCQCRKLRPEKQKGKVMGVFCLE